MIKDDGTLQNWLLNGGQNNLSENTGKLVPCILLKAK